MRDWTKDAANIANKLSAIGYTFSIKRETAGAYDPLLGEYVGGETEFFSCVGVIVNPHSVTNAQEFPTEWVLEKGLITDFVNNGEYIPEIGDLVTYKGTVYILKGITPTQPGGVSLLYRCFLIVS